MLALMLVTDNHEAGIGAISLFIITIDAVGTLCVRHFQLLAKLPKYSQYMFTCKYGERLCGLVNLKACVDAQTEANQCLVIDIRRCSGFK
jgi:hypothetical protein